MNKIARILAIATLLFPAIAAADPMVTLNGVDITGLKNQSFENATVYFDAQGNIAISAPQYKILTTDPKPTQPAAAVPQPAAVPTTTAPSAGWNMPVNVVDPIGSYTENSDVTLPNNSQPTMLLAQFNQPGLLGYSIDIFINGQYIKTFPQGKPQQSLDISSYLHKGKNEIRYRTSKTADAGSSSSATAEISISKVTGQQGNAFELTGQYGKVLIKSTDGERMYFITVNVP